MINLLVQVGFSQLVRIAPFSFSLKLVKAESRILEKMGEQACLQGKKVKFHTSQAGPHGRSFSQFVSHEVTASIATPPPLPR